MMTLYNQMLKIPNMTIYLKENVPESYFYSKNSRIGSLREVL